MRIREQGAKHMLFYAFFGLTAVLIFWYYLTNTTTHFTTGRQFPINSFVRYPLSIPIFLAETFSFLFALYFIYNLVTDRKRPPAPAPLKEKPSVAICIPVYNEPQEVVDRTLRAAMAVRWPKKTVYLLDDSKDQSSIEAMEQLAKKHGAVIVRREGREGYKAGNINNAISKVVKEEFFMILDSDQAPLPEFLERTMNEFSDPDVFFVQTPQYYINGDSPLRRAAKIGTDIFYQTMCVSKAKDGALPFCGTNLIVRSSMFRELKGFRYYTSTEDIELGLRANAKGWRGAYVPEVLAKGYAPPDWRAYQSQQYRWANGNLAILRHNWKELLWGDYSLLYQIHTFFTVGWWFIGITTLVYIITPILSLLLQAPTHHLWLPSALIPLLYINVVCGILMIYVSLNNRVENDKVTLFDSFLQYSMIVNSMFLYARAAINAVLGRYIGFVRTDKKGSSPGLMDVKWNLLLGSLCLALSFYSLYFFATSSTIQQMRTYLPISLWLLFYGMVLWSSILFVREGPSDSSNVTEKTTERKAPEHNAGHKHTPTVTS